MPSTLASCPTLCFLVPACHELQRSLCRKSPSERSPLSARRALRLRGASSPTSLMHIIPRSSAACTRTTKTRSTRKENFEHRLSERMVPDTQPQKKPLMTWRANLYQTRGVDPLEMTKVMPVKADHVSKIAVQALSIPSLNYCRA